MPETDVRALSRCLPDNQKSAVTLFGANCLLTKVITYQVLGYDLIKSPVAACDNTVNQFDLSILTEDLQQISISELAIVHVRALQPLDFIKILS